MKNQVEKFSLKSNDLLPLIAAASALRWMNILKELILKAKSRKIHFTKIYETLLQNYLFTGFPSALNSLKILKDCYPKKIIPKVTDMNLYHFKQIGEEHCKRVYGNKFKKLIKNIKNFSPELADWLVLEGYGKVLGRKGLSFKERELCIVAVLTVLNFEDQLYSHISGAIKAKASIKEVETVIKNLDHLSSKILSRSGIKVSNKYKKDKLIL